MFVLYSQIQDLAGAPHAGIAFKLLPDFDFHGPVRSDYTGPDFCAHACGTLIPDPEKNAPYECGFEAFDDARMKFDVKFYLVAILFIIFDLEVAFLFPWAVAFGDVGLFGFWSMMFFLAVLTVGFAYEWRKGALDWD